MNETKETKQPARPLPTYNDYRKALERTNGVVAEAARLLGVSRVTVNKWITRYPELMPERAT